MSEMRFLHMTKTLVMHRTNTRQNLVIIDILDKKIKNQKGNNTNNNNAAFK